MMVDNSHELAYNLFITFVVSVPGVYVSVVSTRIPFKGTSKVRPYVLQGLTICVEKSVLWC